MLDDPAISLSVDYALAAIGGVVLLLGLVSGQIKERFWISEPLICMLVGIVMGPQLLGLVSVDLQQERGIAIVHEAARITLAISIMNAAVRVTASYVRARWGALSLVLFIGLPLMWLSTSLIAWVFLPVSVLMAFLLGALVSPTDPVLADSIVTGRLAEKSVPAPMRNLLTAESAANDGLALLLVMLPLSLMTYSTGEALQHWLTTVLVWEIIASTLIGGLLGLIASACLGWAYRQPEVEHVSALTATVALALVTLACVDLIGGDGLLAVFAGGLVFGGRLKERDDPLDEHMPEAVARFFDLPVFILLGAILPWAAWVEMGWPGLLFAVVVLLFRRIPAFLLLTNLLKPVKTRRDAFFVGWFGPIGIAALFYVTSLPVERFEQLYPAATLVIFFSVLLHGVSATPLTRAIGGTQAVETETDIRNDRDRDPDTRGARKVGTNPATARSVHTTTAS